MAIYRTGTLTGTGAAINLALGFTPTRFRVVNHTILATPGNVVFESEWFNTMANASAYTITNPAVPVFAYASTNGFTPFQTADSALWTATNLTITGITQAAQAVVTAANSLAVGDVVTFSGVVGMVQINTLRGVVTAATGANFTVNINTTGFTAYSSGGIANVIASSSSAYCVTPTNGLPTQENVGSVGITLGTGVAGALNDVLRWEAYLDTPVTSGS